MPLSRRLTIAALAVALLVIAGLLWFRSRPAPRVVAVGGDATAKAAAAGDQAAGAAMAPQAAGGGKAGGAGQQGVPAAAAAPAFGPVAGAPHDVAQLERRRKNVEHAMQRWTADANDALRACMGGKGDMAALPVALELVRRASIAPGGPATLVPEQVGLGAPAFAGDPAILAEWQRCSAQLRAIAVELDPAHDDVPERAPAMVVVALPRDKVGQLVGQGRDAEAPRER